MNAGAFIEQVYAALRINQGRANIQKRAEVSKNPAWPDGSPTACPLSFAFWRICSARRLLNHSLDSSSALISRAENGRGPERFQGGTGFVVSGSSVSSI